MVFLLCGLIVRLKALTSPFLKGFRNHSAFKEAILINDWDVIVGSDLSSRFYPIKIIKIAEQRHLQVATSSAGMVTAKYLEPMLLEKVNRFFGSLYINAVRTRQGIVPKNCNMQKKIEDLPEAKNLDDALKNLAHRVLNAG